MSSSRYIRQPMEIYQDPVAHDRVLMPSPHRKHSIESSSPLRPIKNASSRRNVVLNPPQNVTSNHSPLKAAHQNSSSPLRASLGDKINEISMPPPRGQQLQTDSLLKKQPLLSKFNTGPSKPQFSAVSSYHSGKENYPHPIYPAPAHQALSNVFTLDGLYGQKAPNKRTLLEAAPIQEQPAKKVKLEKEKEKELELDPAAIVIPNADEFAPLHDDGKKPPHSYAQLIGMALLRSPQRKLTLAQIYKWISDTYSHYNASDSGWQNSIRHNLSLNKAFVKQERPKDDAGKGNYWVFVPGTEHQFIKEKQTKKQTGFIDSISAPPALTAPVQYQEKVKKIYRSATPAIQELPPSSFAPSEPIFPTRNEVSSDATIPASDVFVPDEERDDDRPYPTAFYTQAIQSSPPALLHSSPPVARHSHRRDDTPPPVPLFPTSSRSRSHRRAFASMDDSGFFSSINSSVVKGQRYESGPLVSESDRPRKSIKRGRAEDEIARLRGSSYDSPTKAPIFRHSVSFAPPSSSPIRANNFQMLPPLTPAIKLRPPPQAPPSISPNTNLRIHRDKVRRLVGSPDRGLGSFDDQGIPWSPAFQIDDTSYVDTHFTFDIFNDTTPSAFLTASNGSPEKRPMKKPRMDRAHSTSVLGEVTNSRNQKNVTSTPFMKSMPTLAPAFGSPPLEHFEMSSPINFGSPLKFNSPIRMDLMPTFEGSIENFSGAEFLTDDLTEFSGMDIMQGFQKIGSGQGNPNGPSSRPGLGRSFSTRF